MNALKYHWCETMQLITPLQAVLKHVVSKGFIFVQGTSFVFCMLRIKKYMALFYIKNFSCHVTLLLKRKLQHVAGWVTSGSYVGHIWIVMWVKYVNRCGPLSTLKYSYSFKLLSYPSTWLYPDVLIDSIAIYTVYMVFP